MYVSRIFGHVSRHEIHKALQFKDPLPRTLVKMYLLVSKSGLTLAHRACGQTRTLRCMPPARPGQGKAPQDRCVCIEHNDLAPARLVFKSRECERAIGEISRGRIQAAGRAVGTYPFFLRHNGHFRDRAGRQFGRRTRSRVRGNSIASRPSHAQEGLARPDD